MAEIDYQMALLMQHEFEQEFKSKSNSSASDYQLALELQEQFQLELDVGKPKNNLVYDEKSVTDTTNKCLVDASWEVIDPTPDIHALFVSFNERFFWNKLLTVCVSWSKRMTTCAGICSYQGRNGMCSITLSEPLLKLRPRKDLVETLLHEMIHAYLFITNNNRDRDGHGPEFHKHMYRINKLAGTNITVYHDFHDEVRLYQQHWWRCNGPCQNRKPYFGMVRRAMNRAPGPNDRWWDEHLRNCGGTFIKVKEPEKPKKSGKENKALKKGSDIRKFMTNTTKVDDNIPKITNQVCNTNTEASNVHGFTNLNNNNNNNKATGDVKSNSNNTVVITKSPQTNLINDVNVDYSKVRDYWSKKFPDNSANNRKRSLPEIDEENRAKIPKLSNTVCPVCNNEVPIETINTHLDNCLGNEDESTKECFICDQRILSNKFEEHVTMCAEIKFNDSIEDFPINATQNLINNESTIILDKKQCPLCEVKSEVEDFDVHVEQCLLKLYDELEKKYGEENEQVSCLACNKKIRKIELNLHLDECMSISGIFNDDFPNDEPGCSNEKYNCPFCMKLVLENEMKAHIDQCVIVIDDDTEPDKKELLNSFSDDF